MTSRIITMPMMPPVRDRPTRFGDIATATRIESIANARFGQLDA